MHKITIVLWTDRDTPSDWLVERIREIIESEETMRGSVYVEVEADEM